MTYRDALQMQISALMKVYDNAEGLRDIAGDHKEKEAYNNLRRQLPGIWQQLQNVDNSISDSQAAYKCKGNYSVVVANND